MSHLINEIKNEWPKDLINSVNVVLKEYYHMSIPEEMVYNALIDDLVLAYETFTGGLTDTDVREYLVDRVLEHFGLGNWPMNGNTDEVKDAFFRDLTRAARTHNITLYGD